METQASVFGKLDASYWLGLIAFEQGSYASAVDYFYERTINFLPGNPLTHGALYNLARTFEAQGQREKAIELYQKDTESPGHYGNLLRGKWLSEHKK
jgi:TolA-binding protein